MNRTRLLFLPLIILLWSLSSCGDDKGEPESPLQAAVKAQDAMFNELQHAIVGHWVGAEHYNKGPFRERGWESISYISWDQEYIFNADGTGSDISAVRNYEITWRLEKNPDFINEHWETGTCPAVYIHITYTGVDLSPDQKAIWLDGDDHEFLRLCYAPLGYTPSLLDSGPLGEFGIRYKKI